MGTSHGEHVQRTCSGLVGRDTTNLRRRDAERVVQRKRARGVRDGVLLASEARLWYAPRLLARWRGRREGRRVVSCGAHTAHRQEAARRSSAAGEAPVAKQGIQPAKTSPFCSRESSSMEDSRALPQGCSARRRAPVCLCEQPLGMRSASLFARHGLTTSMALD